MPKFLVIDTETAGGLGYPLTYDVGGVVVDETGYIWERFHWCVLEIIGNPAIMSSAFYADKMPVYWEEVYKGNIQPLPFRDVLRKLTALIDFHDIAAIPAYNMQFDNRALSNTCYHLYENRNWLNRNVPLWCIWAGACDTVLNTEKFIKWAVKNGHISPKGNPRTNAEVCFRYMTGNGKFLEEHTGGRDAEIEAAILAGILRRKKRPTFEVRAMPWRVPAKLYKTMQESGKVPIFTPPPDETPEGPHTYTDTRNINRLD